LDSEVKQSASNACSRGQVVVVIVYVSYSLDQEFYKLVES